MWRGSKGREYFLQSAVEQKVPKTFGSKKKSKWQNNKIIWCLLFYVVKTKPVYESCTKCKKIKINKRPDLVISGSIPELHRQLPSSKPAAVKWKNTSIGLLWFLECNWGNAIWVSLQGKRTLTTNLFLKDWVDPKLWNMTDETHIKQDDLLDFTKLLTLRP